MGKPRLIILIRHAQSEGNKNRAIHQMIPDHRVKLTEEGWRQAEDAGRRLRHLLKPDDTLQVFTSPYRRTRETTEGILKTLTAYDDPSGEPSPFSRSKIKVYEEPRLREQDFGNFQPCSAEMERMWQERADYGHFFYRIPNGESAADAYDRVAGFNESLWRQFGEKEFPSVLVLVTHGLMTRIFLMKWHHWSVEYFEDLRNVNHCEFILMQQNLESGKYVLESQLRTWSELKRQRAEAQAAEKKGRLNPSRRNTLSAFLAQPALAPAKQAQKSPSIPPRQWGGCVEGCDHQHHAKRSESKDLNLPPAAKASKPEKNEADDHALASQEPYTPSAETLDGSTSAKSRDQQKRHSHSQSQSKLPARHPLPSHLTSNSDSVPSSGAVTPHEMPSDDEAGDYFSTASTARDSTNTNNAAFPTSDAKDNNTSADTGTRSIATAFRRAPERKPTPEDIERWTLESGMGRGRRADALGDEPEPEPEGGGGAEGRAQVEEREDREERGVGGSVY